MYQHILVPTDGSDISQKAVAHAIALARSIGARLHTVSVSDPFPYAAVSEIQSVSPQEYLDAQERIAQARIADVVQAASAGGVACEGHVVEADHPWEAIIDQARQYGCDLIVMASHGRRGVSALLLGSETQKVLTHTTIPVLIVR
jgi:nucleotide-binding universal stress UspA family protein